MPAQADLDRIEQKGGLARGAFVIEDSGGRLAELTYRRDASGAWVIDHTYVEPQLRNQGIAERLVDAIVQAARAQNIRLRATCSYAQAVLSKTQAYHDVLAE